MFAYLRRCSVRASRWPCTILPITHCAFFVACCLTYYSYTSSGRNATLPQLEHYLPQLERYHAEQKAPSKRVHRTHIAVISATYFANQSGSYPAHSMVILFNSAIADKRRLRLTCNSVSGGSASVQRAALLIRMPTDMRVCHWTQYIALCAVSPGPTSFALSHRGASKRKRSEAKVPYRVAVRAKFGVVACFSPLFYFERWQVLLVALETYRQFGVDHQVYYIQSMLSTIREILKAYESRNLVKVMPWTTIDLGHEAGLGYDPNEELNWRNQPAAHTDCLTYFKAAADFIIVGDVDDVLFPVPGRTYHEEFARRLSKNPRAAGFLYERLNAEFSSSQHSSEFTLGGLLTRTVITDESVSHKSVIVPSRIRTMWIHHPIHIDDGYRMINVSEADNVMIHFRKWVGVDKGSGWIRGKPAAPNKRHNIRKWLAYTNADHIEQSFRRFIGETGHNETLPMLPSEVTYASIMEKCYTEMFHKFYKRIREIRKCPGPTRCQVPSIAGLNCEVAQSHFAHKEIGQKVFIHYAERPSDFMHPASGCEMG